MNRIAFRNVLPFFALVAFAGGSLAQQGGKPITHEELWLMKRVGTPTVSPDGAWAVFAVNEPAYTSRDQSSDLWIVRTDGSSPARRLTATRGGEGGAAWSPDSRKIAFTARREGDDVSQIYLIDVAAGGEAVRFTSLSTGARSPVWRPDGGAMLFTSSVYPGTRSDSANQRIAKEQQARRYRVRAYESFPIRNWDHWRNEKQTHLYVQSVEPGSIPHDLLAGSALVATAGYGGVSGNSDDDLDAVWAPDGRAIVFAATTNRTVAAFARAFTQLYRIDAAGGEPQPLTGDSSSYRNPRFSRDGTRLYARVEPGTPFVYNHDRLVVFDWPRAAAPRMLTATFDRSVGDFDVLPDGRTVLLTAEDRGHQRLFAVPANGGAVRPLHAEARGVYSGVSVGGRAGTAAVIAQWQSATRPPEIVRLDPATGRHHELTRFATDAAGALDLQPLREFTFTSSRGKDIHNFIALPPGFDETKKYPLLVVMHGGPHGAWQDTWVLRWNYHLLASPGYVVLLTNYTGSTGFSEEFGRAVQGDPLAGPAQEINEAADEAIRRFPFIDGSRQAAGGASYGGHLAYWLQASTDRYRALIAHAGAINMEAQWGTSDAIYHREVYFGGPVWEQGPVWREQNPIRFAARFRTPMLITVGEQDFRVPMNNTLEAWNVLQRLRIPSRLVVFPDENHWIMTGENSRYFYKEVHDWLEKHGLR